MQNNPYYAEYLPLARTDVREIAEYLLNVLQAPMAAEHFAENLDKKVALLENTPYIGATYKECHRLDFEYRHIFMGNFTIFYVVFEEFKKIEIHRVIYSARNMEELV